MSPSARRKTLIGVVGAVALLIVALLIAPSLFDLNKFKPQLIAEVKKATGRDLVVDGPISGSLLPTPSVSVTGVKFVNMLGSKNPNMVEIKSVTVKPSLLALLGGNLEVSSVVLVEPKIVLEINAQGKPNWEFTPSVEQAKPAAPSPSSAKPLSLGELDIENGTILFSDSKAGISVAAQKVNFAASVGSVDGPYSLTGGATINGAPLTIELSVSAKGTNGHAANLVLESGGGKLTFKGNLSELGANARIGGAASVQAESLTKFATTLVELTGLPAPDLPPLLAGKFSFDGSVDASQTSFAAKDFKMTLANNVGSGSLSVSWKPALVVDGKLVLPKLDLDQALAALSQPAAPPAGKPAANKPVASASAPGGCQPACQRHRQAVGRGERGDLQQGLDPQRRARHRRAQWRGGRAATHRDVARRYGVAGKIDHVGRSQSADRRWRFQPGGAQAARHAEMAERRYLIAAGQQADEAELQGPIVLGRRQHPGHRCCLRTRRRQGHRRRGGDVQRAAVGGRPCHTRYVRSRPLPGETERRRRRAGPAGCRGPARQDRAGRSRSVLWAQDEDQQADLQQGDNRRRRGRRRPAGAHAQDQRRQGLQPRRCPARRPRRRRRLWLGRPAS